MLQDYCLALRRSAITGDHWNQMFILSRIFYMLHIVVRYYVERMQAVHVHITRLRVLVLEEVHVNRNRAIETYTKLCTPGY